MEQEKLQRLHETLMKLAPKGKVGGLGYSSVYKQTKGKDDDLPKNGTLYKHILLLTLSLKQILN